MRTTIDRSGRIVVPKAMRDRLGLDGGAEVDIDIVDGRIEIEPAPQPVRLVERDGFLAIEVDGDDDRPKITVEQVRDLLEELRR